MMERTLLVDRREELALDGLLRDELASRYEITGVLGRGGFGTVYRAVHRNTGQDVAVKVLRIAGDWSAAARDKQVARFEREASLCSELLHPNIVRLLERGRPDGELCFAIYEYIPGRTLASVLGDKGALTASEAAEILGQVLDALACAHSRGIVHRDLKPENIMIVEGGQRVHVKVLDFGVGTLVPTARPRDFHNLTLTSEAVGTPSYSAPEQLRGEPPNPKTDIYSWGLVLLECLTGRPVFEGATLAAIYHQQLSPQEIALPASLAGHPLADFLRRALHKQPARRAGDAAQLYKDFRALNFADLVGDLARPRSGVATSARLPRTTVSVSALGHAPELRHVTVLSASVAVVTDGRGDADFELLDALQIEQASLCHDTLVRYGGHLAANICDRSLVYFGYPTASDSDARRAARTALELADEVQRRSEQLQERLGVGLAFRIGMHSGLVYCDRLDQAPTGLTPTRAMRIEALAPLNGIATSEATRRLLAQYAEFHQITTATDGGAPLFTLMGELHADSLSSRLGSEPSGELRGREAELSLLRDRFEASLREQRVTSVLLSGEAGIGKSRVVRALQQDLAALDVAVRELRCAPDAQNAALAPVLAFLRRHYQLTQGLPQDCSERICAALDACDLDTELLAPIFCAWLLLPPPSRYAGHAIAISPPRQRQLLLQASVKLLCALEAAHPAIIVVEDVHWADPTTLEWLQVLCAAQASLLVLITTRPDVELQFESPSTQRIELGRLPPGECLALMRQLVQQRTNQPPSEQLLLQLAERADGIPLFAEELTRALIESQEPAQGPLESGQLNIQPRRLSIPDTLRELLSERLDRMGQAREVAQVAAALGREFDAALLRSTLNYDEAELSDLLQRLVNADLIRRRRQVGQSAYVFRHALVRDAAYDSMPREQRRLAHARIARALESGTEDVRRLHAAELFRHLCAAEAYGPAATYGLLAGQEALAKSSNAEALRYGQAVLDHISYVGAADRPTVEVTASGLITQALLALEGWASGKVRTSIESTLALLPADSVAPERISVLYALFQHFHVASQRAECRNVAREFARLANAHPAPPLQALAETALGVCCHAEGEFGSARQHLERARNLCAPKETDEVVDNGIDGYVWASAQLSLVELYRGETEHSRQLGEEAVARARQLRHVPSLCLALLYVAQRHQFEERRTEAIAVCDELLALSAKYGLPAFEAYAATIRAWAFDDLAGVQAVTDTLRAMNCNLILTYYGSFLVQIEMRRGNVQAALAKVDACLSLCREIDEHCFEAELHRRRAELLLQVDGQSRDAAYLALESAVQLARSQDMARIEAMALTDLQAHYGSSPERLRRLRELASERPSLTEFLVEDSQKTEPPARHVREAC